MPVDLVRRREQVAPLEGRHHRSGGRRVEVLPRRLAVVGAVIVPVMQVRVVRMRVSQTLVSVNMRVRPSRRVGGFMVVLVMFVVDMFMGVGEFMVPVAMLVMLGQVEP